MQAKKMRLFVSACEPSSNLHLSKLLPLLFERFSQNLEVCGVFDRALAEQLPTEPPLWDLKDFAVMGIFDVLKKIFFYKKAIATCSEVAARCDVALLMDSSSFNLPIAKSLKKRGAPTKVVYYILPQVWAWKPWRARTIEDLCDHLYGILPFEASMYPNAVREGRFHYVGHPLLDEIGAFKELKGAENLAQNRDSETCHSAPNSAPNPAQNHAPADHATAAPTAPTPIAPTTIAPATIAPTTIALLPGSRKGEIKRIFPLFAAAAKQLSARKLLVLPTHLATLTHDELLEWYGRDLEDFALSFNANEALLEADFAFVCSGTATLQAVLIGTPLVLGYKSRALEVMILRQFVRLSHIGLANIFYTALKSGSPKGGQQRGADSEALEIHAELIQDELNVPNLLSAYHKAREPHWREEFERRASEIRAYLGHGSAQTMAELLHELLQSHLLQDE